MCPNYPKELFILAVFSNAVYLPFVHVEAVLSNDSFFNSCFVQLSQNREQGNSNGEGSALLFNK